MRRPVILSTLGAVLLLASGCQRSVSAPASSSSSSALSGGSAAPSASAAPSTSAAPGAPAPDASAEPEPEEPVAGSPNPDKAVCPAACAAGTVCALTKRGPACVECAPGSIPTCKGDFVAVCGDDGTLQMTTDCSKKSKRCASGTCQSIPSIPSKVCTPDAVHCHDGNVYKCNATGSGRTLVTTCMTDDGHGGLTVDKGVCQVRKGVAECHEDCLKPDETLVVYGCGACRPPDDNFCATVGHENCMDRICRKFDDPKPEIAGPFDVQGECRRETDGLVVPGSDKRSGCEGAGPIGDRVVSYQVCRGGKAIAATRKEPCKK